LNFSRLEVFLGEHGEQDLGEISLGELRQLRLWRRHHHRVLLHELRDRLLVHHEGCLSLHLELRVAGECLELRSRCQLGVGGKQRLGADDWLLELVALDWLEGQLRRLVGQHLWLGSLLKSLGGWLSGSGRLDSGLLRGKED